MSAVVRIRGIPYSAKADDIIDFFKDVKIKGEKRGIYFPQGPNGRSNGEAFIELESDVEIEKAMSHHKENMGRRYIEVFKATKHEMDYAMGKNVPHPRGRPEFVVRLRGLPYDTEKKEIFAFFNGLDIAPNGIGLLVDHMGRCTGEAYVQFTSAEMLARAKEKHMEKIGHRYIEIFESTMLEANTTIQRQMEMNRRSGSGGGPGPSRAGRDPYPPPVGYYGPPRGPHGPPFGGPEYGRGPPPGRPGPYARPYPPHGPPGYMTPPRDIDGPPNYMGMGKLGPPGPGPNLEPEDSQSMTGHSVRLRGLPFSATVEEIDRFFAPLQPVNIRLRMNPAGRPVGEATVDFASHDEAKEAMKKDREKIGSRYIELFLASTPMGTMDRMATGGSSSGGVGGVPPHGQRSYGGPPSPGYGGGGRGAYYDDPMPYGSGSDYGSYQGYDDVGYSSGNDYGTMGYDGYYGGGSNGHAPPNDMYDYRPPPRYSGYQWS